MCLKKPTRQELEEDDQAGNDVCLAGPLRSGERELKTRFGGQDPLRGAKITDSVASGTVSGSEGCSHEIIFFWLRPKFFNL